MLQMVAAGKGMLVMDRGLDSKVTRMGLAAQTWNTCKLRCENGDFAVF